MKKTKPYNQMRPGYLSAAATTVLLSIATVAIVYVTAAVTSTYNKWKDNESN
jgi:hypothetical protein